MIGFVRLRGWLVSTYSVASIIYMGKTRYMEARWTSIYGGLVKVGVIGLILLRRFAIFALIINLKLFVSQHATVSDGRRQERHLIAGERT